MGLRSQRCIENYQITNKNFQKQMKQYFKPILLAVVFLVMQGLAGVVMTGILLFVNPDFKEATLAGSQEAAMEALPVSWLAMATVVAGILTVLVASAMKLISWRAAFRWSGRQTAGAWLPLLAAVVGIFAIDVLEEQLHLPNLLEAQFADMMHSTLGILTICLVAPIVEELCFREAVMGGLLRRGAAPWAAILISALLFGLIHANPVQIVVAGLMGIMLGIIYYKSGSIVLPTVLHILNNSVATFLTVTFGQDASFTEWADSVVLSVLAGLLAAVVSIVLFVRYWRSH